MVFNQIQETEKDLVGAAGNLDIARISLILAMETFDYYTGKNLKADGEAAHGGSY